MLAFMLTLGSASWAQCTLPTIEIQAGNISVCGSGPANLNVNLSASGFSNFTDITVIWNTGQTGSNISVSSPGIYTATVTAKCNSNGVAYSGSGMREVYFGSNPVYTLLSVSSTCVSAGQTATLQATTYCQTGPLSGYRWFRADLPTNNSNPVFTELFSHGNSASILAGPGVYYVLPPNCPQYCTKPSNIVTITEMPTAVSIQHQDFKLCAANQSLVLVATSVNSSTNAYIVWRKNGVVLANNSWYLNATAGTYTVQAVTSAGCSSAISAPVTVSLGASPTSISQVSFTGCTSTFSTPTIAGVLGYSWTISNISAGTTTNPAIMGSALGNTITVIHGNAASFNVNVRANYACGLTNGFATQAVSSYKPATYAPFDLICPLTNKQAKITVQFPQGLPPSHKWKLDNTNIDVQGLIGGQWLNGTHSSESVSGNSASLVVNFSANPSKVKAKIKIYSSCTSVEPYIFASGEIPFSEVLCSAPDPDPIGARRGLSETIIKLYPNPAAQEFTIRLAAGETSAKVCMSDAAGKIQRNFNLTANETTVSLQGLAAGWYNVAIQTATGKENQKLLVQP